jgi:hypothetical protein
MEHWVILIFRIKFGNEYEGLNVLNLCQKFPAFQDLHFQINKEKKKQKPMKHRLYGIYLKLVFLFQQIISQLDGFTLKWSKLFL